MITLLTGLPGNGKTLFALWYIKQKAEKEQREVYYHNIKDLTLPWTPLEAKDWMSCPKGAIIVIDEAQFVFPKLPNGAAKPAHYDQLAVHRHSGFDIYIITQHPSLIDNFVRQLVGQHFHAIRKFGMQRATVYEWSAVQPAPQNPSSHKNAISLKWAYPKEVYGYYKSAEVHTVKRQIPAKVILAVLFIFGVIGFGYWSMDRYQHRYDKPKPVEGSPVAQGSVSAAESARSPSGVQAKGEEFDPVADAKHFVAMNTPRVEGLPQTAPKYDDLTKPVRVPVPAMCVQIGDVRKDAQLRCKCYSQQGTPIAMDLNMCVDIAQHGFFLDFDPEAGRQQVARAQSSQQVLSGRPDDPIPDRASRERGPQVAVIENLPDPPIRSVRVTGQTALK